MKCENCHGTGQVADYVGLEMKCTGMRQSATRDQLRAAFLAGFNITHRDWNGAWASTSDVERAFEKWLEATHPAPPPTQGDTMEQVKTPGQIVYAQLREWMLLGVEYKELRSQFQKALEAAAQTVLAADLVRCEALALAENLSILLSDWHEVIENDDPIGKWHSVVKDERQVICRVRALLAKAKG